MNTEANLPRATAEMAGRYDEIEKMFRGELSDEQRDSLNKELAELVESHNWFNCEFTDPETGKVGVKDIAGNVLVPARYDGALFLENYRWTPRAPHGMSRDGKCGLVAADGSGVELSPFTYDDVQRVVYTPLYAAWWGGVADRFGLILSDGTVVVENILTEVGDPLGGILEVTAGDKHGAIDTETLQVVDSEYDETYIDADDNVVFVKGDVKGHIDTEGRFITLEDYENGNYEGDGCILSFACD